MSLTAERRPLAVRTVIAVGIAATAVAGCGSSTTIRTSGAAVFSTHCAVCHSLSGNSSPTQQGGDLKNLHLPRRDLLQLSAEMPPVHGRMTARELQAVVAYVQSVQRR